MTVEWLPTKPSYSHIPLLLCIFTFLADILYSHHGEIITLLCIAHELMDSLGHLGYELARLMLLMGEGTQSHFFDTIHLELHIISIHSFCQSIGKEEDGGAC